MAATGYSYYIKAKDAAGNVGPQSSTVSATTKNVQAAPQGGKVDIIKGKVREIRTLKGISGAKVTVVINGTTRTFVTDSSGYYEMRKVPLGNYSLSYAAPGYETDTKTTSLNKANKAFVVYATLTRN
jgi:hypothetical protein